MFNGFANGINEEAISAYKKFLLDRFYQAFIPIQKNLDNNFFKAEIKRCHDNTEEYCKINHGCMALYGWLCLNYEGNQYITFASHSIIRSANGEFIDITPTELKNDNKFLEALLPKPHYDALIFYLYESQGNTIMNARKPA